MSLHKFIKVKSFDKTVTYVGPESSDHSLKTYEVVKIVSEYDYNHYEVKQFNGKCTVIVPKRQLTFT